MRSTGEDRGAYAEAVQRRLCLRLMSHTTQVSRIDLGAGTGKAEKGKSKNEFYQKLELVRVEMELRLRRPVWAKKMTKGTVRRHAESGIVGRCHMEKVSRAQGWTDLTETSSHFQCLDASGGCTFALRLDINVHHDLTGVFEPQKRRSAWQETEIAQQTTRKKAKLRTCRQDKTLSLTDS